MRCNGKKRASFTFSRFIAGAFLLFASFFAPPQARAQTGGLFTDVTINSRGLPAGGVPISVCQISATQGTNSTPCSPLQTIYADSQLSIPISTNGSLTTPFASDGLGNYQFYAPPGLYMVQWYGPTVNLTFKTIQVSGTGTSSSGTGVSSVGTSGSAAPFLNLPSVGTPLTTPVIIFTVPIQFANCFFGGPPSGAPASPTCRPIVGGDLPLINLVSGVTGNLPIANMCPTSPPGSPTTMFMRGDCTWAVPPGGGGGGAGTVNSGTANQMAGYTATGTAVSGLPNVTFFNGSLLLGIAGSNIGSLTLFNTQLAFAGVIVPPPTGPLAGITWTMPTVTAAMAGFDNTSRPKFGLPFLNDTSSKGDMDAVAPPTTNCVWVPEYNVVANAAVAPTINCIGLAGRAITGATSSDTIAFTDNQEPVTHIHSASGTVNPETLPTPTTLGNANFFFKYCNDSPQTDTIVPTTWTIQAGNAAAGANLSVGPGACYLIRVDPSGSTNWLADFSGNPPASQKYSANFGSTTSLSVSAATHGLGASFFNISIYDSATPHNRVEPSNVTVDGSGNVVVTFAVAQVGQIVIQ